MALTGVRGRVSSGFDERATANLLGALAIAVTDEMTGVVSRTLRGGVSAAAALLSIGQRPGCTIAALGRVLGREHSSTVRIIDRLEASGLVARSTSLDDARCVELHLTSEGRRLSEELREARHRVLARRLEGLGTTTRRRLHEVLDRLLASASGDHDHARNICRFCDHAVCRGEACPVGRRFLEASGEGHASR